jgi:hypothetical protein
MFRLIRIGSEVEFGSEMINMVVYNQIVFYIQVFSYLVLDPLLPPLRRPT